MIRAGLILVNLALLALALYLGNGLLSLDRSLSAGEGPGDHTVREEALPDPAGDPAAKAPAAQVSVAAIVKRNLFGTAPRTGPRVGSSRGEGDAPARTSLDLVLRGTVVGRPKTASYAVIEDPKKKIQALYHPGEQVAGAEILSIDRNRVILLVNGKRQRLETFSGSPSAKGEAPATDMQTAGLPRDPLEGFEVPADQIMFRRFRAGKDLRGLLAYKVRPGSRFHRAGLRSGDVITRVAGQPMKQTRDARYLQKALEEGGQIRLGILRRGAPKTLIYDASAGTAVLTEEGS